MFQSIDSIESILSILLGVITVLSGLIYLIRLFINQKNEIVRLTDENENLLAENEKCTRANILLTTETEKLTGENTRLSAECDRLAKEEAPRRKRYRAATRKLEALRQEMATVTAEQDRLNRALNISRAEATSTQEQMVAQQEALSRWQTYGREIKAAFDQLAANNRDLVQQISQVSGSATEGDTPDQVVEKLREVIEAQQKRIEEQESVLLQWEEQVKSLDEKLILKQGQLSEAQQLIASLRRSNQEITEQLERVWKLRGRIWETPVTSKNVAPFVPLRERRVPIISVLNLKGGVGKTTLTANIAATLGRKGQKVLIVDLDYQRSLTQLCVRHPKPKMLTLEGRCLQHFFFNPESHTPGQFRSFAQRIESIPNVEIIINTEAISVLPGEPNQATAHPGLEDAEMHLLAKWLMNPQDGDARFLLREALHSSAFRNYDYILLDCPPRISSGCINALAASDFVLLPVLMDMTSAHSAPNMLRKLKRLRSEGVLPNLDVLGVLANRAGARSTEDLPSREAGVWSEIQTASRFTWDKPVYFFSTTIQQSRFVAEAATKQHQEKSTGTVAAFHAELAPVFDNLVTEMEMRIEHERQRFEEVSGKSGHSNAGAQS